jgi:hypothetical protein
VMYIPYSNRVVLHRLGLDFLPVKISSVSFCPFQSFSNIARVLGERVLVLSEVHVVLHGHILCVGLNVDGYVIDFIFYVNFRFRYDFLGVVGAYGASDSARPVNQNTAMDIWRNFGRYIYQLVEKSGWIYQLVEKPGWVWFPPSLVVLLPFGLYLSPVSQGCWWPLRCQIPYFTGDVMVGGHLL